MLSRQRTSLSISLLITSIAAGLGFAQTSNVVGWGINDFGQLDIPPGLIASKIAKTWGWRSLVIKPDGTLAAWGQNNYGESTVPPGLAGVVAASGGPYHTLAVKSDKTVVAWGNNDYGQLDVPAGLNNVKDVAAGYYHSVALRHDGTVVVWGLNADYLRPPDVSGVIAISAGVWDTFALKSDGTVVNWGSNPYPTPVPAGLTDVVAISKGWEHALALKSDGTVVGWGNSNYGLLDIPPNLTDVVSISAGDTFSLAVKSDGTVVTWGRDAVSPPADLGPVQSAVALGAYHYLALRQTDTTPPVLVPTLTGTGPTRGWYRSNVNVNWTVDDPESGIVSSAGCTPATLTADSAGTTLTCSATNGAGLTSSLPVTVRIDKTAPSISGLPAAGCSLWPPNGKWVQVGIVTASDALSGVYSYNVGAGSSEPSDPKIPDVALTSAGSLSTAIQLRADRSGKGSGRTYTITAHATDRAGNVTNATATCVVPHSKP